MLKSKCIFLWSLGPRVRSVYSSRFLTTNGCTVLEIPFHLLDYSYGNLTVLWALAQLS